jgi:hypothetical protein
MASTSKKIGVSLLAGLGAGLKVGGKGWYDVHEHQLKEEEAEADFLRKKALKKYETDLWQQKEKWKLDEVDARSDSNYWSDELNRWLTKKEERERRRDGGDNWAEGLITREEREIGLYKKEEEAKMEVARDLIDEKVELEQTAKRLKETSEARHAFDILRANGQISTDVDFEGWYIREQARAMAAKDSGITAEMVRKEFNAGIEAFGTLSEQTRAKYLAASGGDEEKAAELYGIVRVKTFRGVVESGLPASPAEAGERSGLIQQQIRVNRASELQSMVNTKGMEETIKYVMNETGASREEVEKDIAGYGISGKVKTKKPSKDVTVLEKPLPGEAPPESPYKWGPKRAAEDLLKGFGITLEKPKPLKGQRSMLGEAMQ